MLQKLVKDGSLKGLEVKGGVKEIGSCPTCLETKFSKQVALVKNRVLATVGDKEWIPYVKWYGSAPAVNMLRAFGCMVVFHVPKEKRGKLEASGRWDEVQQPSRQVEVAVSEEEMSGVTEEGGAAEVEQQQQHESPPRVPHPPERPRRDVRPPNEVGLSSCETEYMALHHGAKEVVWLRRLLEELGVGQEEPTVVFCDNESAVKLAKNACLHGLTKHIRPKWHWVRRLLDKEVRLEIVKTHQQAADIFTKRICDDRS
ncbi:hypothetical protein CLOP_g24047 [Closterium sp. NIES-67]|nr:hypothetical protein CLOP_g24047 [Closterium sp. NIES-67]